MNNGIETAIDRAHAAMIAGGEDELVSFYRILLESELYLILEEEDGQVTAEPKLVPIDDGWFVLAFDTEERVLAFNGKPVKPMKLLGSWLVNLLQGRGAGIALNMGDAPSAIQIPSDALDWIFETLQQNDDDHEGQEELKPDTPVEKSTDAPTTGRLKAFMTPKHFPDSLQVALSKCLEPLRRNFDKAILLRAEYDDGHSGYLLAVAGVETEHKNGIAAAISDAIARAERKDTPLDVTFLNGNDPSFSRIFDVGIPL